MMISRDTTPSTTGVGAAGLGLDFRRHGSCSPYGAAPCPPHWAPWASVPNGACPAHHAVEPVKQFCGRLAKALPGQFGNPVLRGARTRAPGCQVNHRQQRQHANTGPEEPLRHAHLGPKRAIQLTTIAWGADGADDADDLCGTSEADFTDITRLPWWSARLK